MKQQLQNTSDEELLWKGSNRAANFLFIPLLSYIPLRVTEMGENRQDLRTWTGSKKVPMAEEPSINSVLFQEL